VLDVVPLFQFFSQRNRDHFHTYNQREATRRYRLKRNNNVVCRILRRGLPEGTRPLYRYFDGSHRRRSRTLNDHFMTTIEAETRSAEFRSYRRRSIAGYCFTSQKSDTLPLHRYHLKTGNVRDHYYTTEENGPQGYTLDDFTDPCYVYPA
uniref:DUF5648 domain-containing protein n=1 Tax=Clytia hemisphaerica TaxID=252671 RepID=A0A7M5XAX5_9CNID